MIYYNIIISTNYNLKNVLECFSEGVKFFYLY